MCNKTPLMNQAALFQDSAIRITGSPPAGLAAPNNYLTAGDLPTFTYTQFARLVGTTSDTKITVVAANWAAIGTAYDNEVSVYIDGVFTQTLGFYAGHPSDGIPFRQDITLDGNPHTIELEESACILGVYGNVNWTPKYAPKFRVLMVGDSITTGQGSVIPSDSYMMKTRHSLASGVNGYGITCRARSNSLLQGLEPSGTKNAPLLDGTTRNIYVVALMINDFIVGCTVSQFANALDTYVADLLSHAPAGTRIILQSSPQCPIAGGGAATLAQLRATFAAKAAAMPGVVYWVDNTNLYPGGTPWTTYTTDGVHPTAAGHNLLYTALRPVVIQAATDP